MLHKLADDGVGNQHAPPGETDAAVITYAIRRHHRGGCPFQHCAGDVRAEARPHVLMVQTLGQPEPEHDVFLDAAALAVVDRLRAG